uniref:C-type lectin domain-containing protein n=1 Tax=Branchiostoma floridae TaxID=7739 RepID=C3ZFH1_BRAFL|eukprot:XP_002592714.1 hypothetical protein BRAFLDRAFT_67154 [Branchiostoma floridae]
MSEQAEPTRSSFPSAGSGQTNRPLPQPPPVRQPKGASDQRQQNQGTSSDMYGEAERVYYTIKDEDLPPSLRGVGQKQASPKKVVETSGPPPHPTPVHQGCSRGRVRHDNGASDKLQEEQEDSSHAYRDGEDLKRHATYTSEGGASGRRSLCSFFRSHQSCMAAGIAVLLSLVAVGFAPLIFINKEEISQLSTTVEALKRDLEKERSRTATFEQRLHEISKTLPSCPKGYTVFRGICYKAFNIQKTFSEAAAACCEDGGTLAMPRDAETNDFLISLYKSVGNRAFWFGLHDQFEEGSFEWMDGSALGNYSSWGREQPNNGWGNQDCVYYNQYVSDWKNKWYDYRCDCEERFICQAVPGTSYNRTIS